MAAARLQENAPAGPQVSGRSDTCHCQHFKRANGPLPHKFGASWIRCSPGPWSWWVCASSLELPPWTSCGLWTEPCWFSKLVVLGVHLSQVKVLKIGVGGWGVGVVAQWAVQISLLSGPPLWCREDGRGWTYDGTVSQSLLPSLS